MPNVREGKGAPLRATVLQSHGILGGAGETGDLKINLSIKWNWGMEYVYINI